MIVGSFLNVVIFRMNTGMGLGGRSQCFSCNKVLHWYELIPLVSFIVQKGKCRKCKSAIHIQYILVEACTAVLFILPVISFGISHSTSILLILLLWLFAAISIVITAYDIRHKVIPWQGIIGMFVLGGILVVAQRIAGVSLLLTQAATMWDNVAAMVVLPLPFFLIWLFSRGRMFGLGDVELMIPLGFSLGLIYGAYALLLAFWSATIVVGCILIAQPRLLVKGNKRIMKQAIPFGPFLLLGWYVMLVFGNGIANVIASLLS